MSRLEWPLFRNQSWERPVLLRLLPNMERPQLRLCLDGEYKEDMLLSLNPSSQKDKLKISQFSINLALIIADRHI